MICLYTKYKIGERQFLPFIKSLEKLEKNYKLINNNLKELRNIVIEKEKIIIVLGTYVEFFEVYYYLFQYKNKIKYVYRARGIFPEESYLKKNSYLKYKFLCIVEKKILLKSDYILTVTENQKKHYIAKYNISNDKMGIIHNYFSSSDYDLKNQNKNNYKKEIVYVGGVSKWQKIDTIYKLFKGLQKIDENINYLICTEEKNYKIFDSKFKDIKNITFETYNNYEALIDRISKASMGIIFRDNNIVNRCASPFKIIDYIKAQLPIVMSKDIGDYSEVFKDSKFVHLVSSNNNLNIEKIYNFLNESVAGKLNKEIQKFAKKELDFFEEFRENIKKIEDIK